MRAQSAENSLSEYGSKLLQPLPPSFRSILEAALALREDVKKPTVQRPKSCPAPQAAPLQNQKQSSLPNDEWVCLDCGEKEKLYLIVEKKRVGTIKLSKTDLVVCETCGFRMYGKTMNAWYYGKQKQKRGGSKTKE